MLYNNAVQIKRDVLFRTTKALIRSDFDSLNRIPLECAPRDKNNIRCCIHKDRAVLKYRVMAALGFSIEDETDELKSLSEYGKDSFNIENIDKRVLTVIHDACSSCQLGHHYISDVCVGCMARPCNTVCPKGAITMVNGRSVINKAQCIDCGKCTNVCPYNAVVKVSVPCESSCPVSALKKGDQEVAEIDRDKCISCGKCIKSCPFGAIVEKSQISKVISALGSDKKVNAIIAPSIVGQFPGSIYQIKTVVKQLGYNKVIDLGDIAEYVADFEAKEFLEKKTDLLTSSCCPSFRLCIDRHAEAAKPYVSKSSSPMILAGEAEKKDDAECINVFIGPCNAKKVESFNTGVIDYVLTFEELGAHIMAMELDVASVSDCEHKINKTGYGFARSGGVLEGVSLALRDKGVWITGETISGIDESAVKKLKLFDRINKPYDFLEVMACEGGCLGGPGVIVSPKISSKALDSLKKF